MFDKVALILETLPCHSHLKRKLDPILKQAQEKIASSSAEELGDSYWWPLFLFVYRRSLDEILDFEDDLSLVLHHKKPDGCKSHLSFLEADGSQHGDWESTLFEIFVESRFIREMPDRVSVDAPLPNGKEPDILIRLGESSVYLECTVLTDSDKSRQILDIYQSEVAMHDRGPLVTSGDPNIEVAGRFYDKIFEKLAPQLDPKKSQLSDHHPNVLLISFNTVLQGVVPDDPFVRHALEELFSERVPQNGSLHKWLKYKFQKLQKPADYDGIKQLTKRISAIFLFMGGEFHFPDATYGFSNKPQLNPHASHPLAEEEVQHIKKILEFPPSWWIRSFSDISPFQTTTTAKGQIVIPSKIRERLGIKEGTKIQVKVNEQTGEVILNPITRRRIESFAGRYFGEPLVEALLDERRHEREVE